MIGKALEMAILQLQAVATETSTNQTVTDNTATNPTANTTLPEEVPPTPITPVTPIIPNVDVKTAITFAYQLAAFVYLGLGIAYCFFGALFVQLFISLFTGLVVGAIPYFLFGGSTGGLWAAIIVFGVTSLGCWHLHHLHAGLLGAGVGTYVGSVAWALLAVFGIPLYVKYIFEVFGAAILGWYAYHHSDKFVVHATAFLGSNMIATSITLFTNDSMGPWGNLGVQVACIVIFSIAGHHVQEKLGLEEKHHKKMETLKNKKNLSHGTDDHYLKS